MRTFIVFFLFSIFLFMGCTRDKEALQPSIERTDISGRDIAEVFGWKIYKFKMIPPKDKAKFTFSAEEWTGGENKPVIRKYGSITGIFSPGDLLIKLPSNNWPQIFCSLSGGGSMQAESGIAFRSIKGQSSSTSILKKEKIEMNRDIIVAIRLETRKTHSSGTSPSDFFEANKDNDYDRILVYKIKFQEANDKE